MRPRVLLLFATWLVFVSACAQKYEGPIFRPPTTDATRKESLATGKRIDNPVTITLDSTVRITDEVLGSGKEATRGSVVLVHYVGTLEDGTTFDKTKREGQPARFVLSTGPGGVIAGFVEGITGMHAGGVRTIVIPWVMGYGASEKGNIPARSNLKFQVTLVAVP